MKRKRKEKEKQKRKKKRNTLDNSFIVVLTGAEQIATLNDGEELFELLKLKAGALHEAMEKIGYSREEIMKNDKQY